MLDSNKLLEDGNLARALIWRGLNENGTSKFRWSTVSVLNGPNAHGQYVVMSVRDGWYAVTDNIRNINEAEKYRVFTK
jgi:hypothetical protein